MGNIDLNSPKRVVVPVWGPDAYSIRMAAKNSMRANPVIAARSGVGVRRAPRGSVTERTSTDAYLLPQQNFRSIVGTVPNPTIKNAPITMSYPNTTSPIINPAFLMLGQTHRGGVWGG